jgi:hypothetical protein
MESPHMQAFFFHISCNHFFFHWVYTQKIKIKINKYRAVFCAMVSGQGMSNMMGSQPPALGACYLGNAPDLGHYPT